MKHRRAALVILLFVPAVLACVKPRGGSAGSKREQVRIMRTDALSDFYRANPGLESRLEGASGYAIFTSVSIKVFTVSSGSGYGLAVNNRTGQETFMRMFTAGGGLGMGLKDLRTLFVFHSESALDAFIEEGIEFGGNAGAAATAGDVGVSAGTDASVSAAGSSGAVSGRAGGALTDAIGDGVEVFQLTEAGLALSATLEGTRYWKDGELN